VGLALDCKHRIVHVPPHLPTSFSRQPSRLIAEHDHQVINLIAREEHTNALGYVELNQEPALVSWSKTVFVDLKRP
jgi:hypothetical protein